MVTQLDSRVLIAALAVGGLIYWQTLGTGAGLARSAGARVAKGAGTVYGDARSVARTGYRDIAKPVGRTVKSGAKGVKKRAGKLGRWIKRRF
jgi:hypothetical protein